MTFTLMCPNFWRYYLTLLVRAREEVLEFGLNELKQLCILKCNSGFLGTVLRSPRAGRTVVDGISGRDDPWREKFIIFTVNQASVGDFDINWIPREWNDEVGMFVFPYLIEAYWVLLF